MKVSFVYTSPYPRKGGHTAADRRVRDLVRGMRGAGAEVTLAIPRFHQDKCIKESYTEFDVELFGFDIADKIFFLGRISFWISLLWNFIWKSYDVAFFYNTRVDSVLPALIMRLVGRKVAWEVCDLHRYLKSGNGLMAVMSYISETMMAYIANTIFVISSDLKKNILKINKNARINIVPILVDTKTFGGNLSTGKLRENYGLSTHAVLISYVGGMWKHQGVADLISAFKILAAKNNDVKLLIAGKYVKSKIHDDVLGMVYSLDLQDRVILPGWVDTDGVLEILYSSDILVLPQKRDPFTSAGMPTKLAEYCATGKAIVATDVGDLGLYLRDKENCLLCEPDNPEVLMEAIFLLASNEELRQKLSENARLLALKHFDYEVNGERIVLALNGGA